MECGACPAGKYAAAAATSCELCPAESSSSAASVSLEACRCNAGFTGMDGGQCDRCQGASLAHFECMCVVECFVVVLTAYAAIMQEGRTRIRWVQPSARSVRQALTPEALPRAAHNAQNLNPYLLRAVIRWYTVKHQTFLYESALRCPCDGRTLPRPNK